MSNFNQGKAEKVQVKINEAFVQKEPEKGPLDGLSSTGRSAVSTFMQYAIEMHPDKRNTEQQAIAYQVGLYRAITMTINRNAEDFNLTWARLLEIIEANKNGAFHESKIFRYMANITLTDDQRTAFRRFYDLMRITASPVGRQIALKQVDLKSALKFDVTPVGQQRVLNFYQRWMTV